MTLSQPFERRLTNEAKGYFFEGEGNAWFARNAVTLAKHELPGSDLLLLEILNLKGYIAGDRGTESLLEVGCGPGLRFEWIQQQMGWACHGIDLSDEAVKLATGTGVLAQVGTADQLTYAGKSFNIIVFGFCLYLCDRDDRFKIAAEADRGLKNPGWLLIKDFYSPTPSAKEYHHKEGFHSYKIDYKSLFTWNPDYSLYSHRVAHHKGDVYTDDRQGWWPHRCCVNGDRLK